ncbi:hypothetical protein HDV00_004035 [Rhizophlyctis rosea]|nr:hypothetical protein HDV00_004035 [Rhizophlyctis rosea]
MNPDRLVINQRPLPIPNPQFLASNVPARSAHLTALPGEIRQRNNFGSTSIQKINALRQKVAGANIAEATKIAYKHTVEIWTEWLMAKKLISEKDKVWEYCPTVEDLEVFLAELYYQEKEDESDGEKSIDLLEAIHTQMQRCSSVAINSITKKSENTINRPAPVYGFRASSVQLELMKTDAGVEYVGGNITYTFLKSVSLANPNETLDIPIPFYGDQDTSLGATLVLLFSLRGMFVSENPIEDNDFRVKPECLNWPVLPNVSLTNEFINEDPAPTTAFTRTLKEAAEAIGIDPKTLSPKAIRKGVLRQMEVRLGPAVTKRVGGHAPNSRTLNQSYLSRNCRTVDTSAIWDTSLPTRKDVPSLPRVGPRKEPVPENVFEHMTVCEYLDDMNDRFEKTKEINQPFDVATGECKIDGCGFRVRGDRAASAMGRRKSLKQHMN